MEGVGEECASERATKIFNNLDINGDGEVDEEEFVRGCLDDEDLICLLNAGGLNDEDRQEECQ